jgi:hypothetical protein
MTDDQRRRVAITPARRHPSPTKLALLRLKALVERSGDPRDLIALSVVARELREQREELAQLREVNR